VYADMQTCVALKRSNNITDTTVSGVVEKNQSQFLWLSAVSSSSCVSSYVAKCQNQSQFLWLSAVSSSSCVSSYVAKCQNKKYFRFFQWINVGKITFWFKPLMVVNI